MKTFEEAFGIAATTHAVSIYVCSLLLLGVSAAIAGKYWWNGRNGRAICWLLLGFSCFFVGLCCLRLWLYIRT